MSRRTAVAALVGAILVGAAAFSGYFFMGGNGYIKAWQVALHPESSLTYPHSYDASSYQADEDDPNAWFNFENTTPLPARAEVQFYTKDSVANVVAWYQRWLSARGWLDVVVQADSERYWDRGTNEEFLIGCGYQRDNPDNWCDAQYHLLSSRFHQGRPAAPPFGDPVSLEAVQQRQVAMGATGVRPDDPREGTPEATAARNAWPNWPSYGRCCGVPVILRDVAHAEQTVPPVSAYHVFAVQAAEYDHPLLHDSYYFGLIDHIMGLDLTGSGFVLVTSGPTVLFGRAATEYEYKRDSKEVVFYAISYGPVLHQEPNQYSYRVTTLSVIYDVTPKSCSLATSDCLDVLFTGDSSTGWSF